MLYYSPLFFGGAYQDALGRTPAKLEEMMKADFVHVFLRPFALGVVFSAVALYVCIHFYQFVRGAYSPAGVVSVYFWGWLGFAVLPGFSGLLWDDAAPQLFLIHHGGRLLTGVVAGITYVALAPAAAAATAAVAAAAKGKEKEEKSEAEAEPSAEVSEAPSEAGDESNYSEEQTSSTKTGSRRGRSTSRRRRVQ
jgi:hypothetical protein